MVTTLLQILKTPALGLSLLPLPVEFEGAAAQLTALRSVVGCDEVPEILGVEQALRLGDEEAAARMTKPLAEALVRWSRQQSGEYGRAVDRLNANAWKPLGPFKDVRVRKGWDQSDVRMRAVGARLEIEESLLFPVGSIERGARVFFTVSDSGQDKLALLSVDSSAAGTVLYVTAGEAEDSLWISAIPMNTPANRTVAPKGQNGVGPEFVTERLSDGQRKTLDPGKNVAVGGGFTLRRDAPAVQENPDTQHSGILPEETKPARTFLDTLTGAMARTPSAAESSGPPAPAFSRTGGFYLGVKRFEIIGGGEIIVGRAQLPDGVTYAIPDGTISRKHALLRLRPDGRIELEDLGSHNGTSVNGKLLKPHRPRVLKEGDVVEFSDTHPLVFGISSSISRPPVEYRRGWVPAFAWVWRRLAEKWGLLWQKLRPRLHF